MKIILDDHYKRIVNEIFDKLGEGSFIVGGFIRDYLLNKKSDDIDFACPILPNDIHSLFPDSLFYPKFGTASFYIDKIHFTIASFRKESDYKDYRHPQNVTFVKSFKEDYLRRDFTINSLYLNEAGFIFDPSNMGIDDLKNKKIRFISDPNIRIYEDPLRIIRALRFSYKLHLDIEEKSYDAIIKNKDLIKKINRNKIMEELHKIDEVNRKKIIQILDIK